MPDWKTALEEFLGSGEASASSLDAEARATAGRILLEASGSNETEALLHELDQQYPVRAQGGLLVPRRAYLRGRSLLEVGRAPEALQTLLPLCEKTEQEAQWATLAVVADEILQQTASVEASRYLTKAVEQAGHEVAPQSSLQHALDLFPDESRLCWLVAEQLERIGESERALGLFTGCLPALIDGREFERLEEAFIRLEDLDDPETVGTMLEACVRLAGIKEWKRAESCFEPLLPRIRKAGLVPQAWEHLLRLLPKAPPESSLRRYIMEIAPDALPGVEGVLDLLARSGILDPKVKAPSALHRLEQLLEFAPGYRVIHASWGAGRIRVNEGDALIIDFPGRLGHRMSLAIARNALTVIPPDDLRVRWTEEPDSVREMSRLKPADLAYLAIRELGGRAATQDLRRRLTAEIIPSARWAAWWKDARVGMETDERFDLSESFRQVYAVRTPRGRGEDMLLPRMDRRRGIRANLNLLRRFLEQHPDYQERAVKMYTPVLIRWLRDEHTNPEAALAICLLLDRWGLLDQKDLEQSLRAVLSQSVEASAYADLADQRFLVSQALRLRGLEREAIIFALGSRFPEIREMALARLREDPEQGERILSDLLSRPEERPQTAMSVSLMLIAENTPRESFHPSVWRAAASLCRLIERTGRDVLRNQALRLFSPRSSLAEMLRREPVPDDVEFHLTDMLKRWRESERFLFPVLDFFESLGMTEMVQSVRADRSAATNRLIVNQQQAQTAYTGLYMTHASYERLEREREALRYDLNHVLPDVIRKARELGDLSENAEYNAAKERQARETARIAEIDRVLGQTTLIENVRVPDGEVGPGSWTEVRVVSGDGAAPGTMRIFWILGEGDRRFGEEVVSTTAPIGRALLGHRVGDKLSLDLVEGHLEVEIVSAAQRFPSGESAQHEIRSR